MTRFCLIQLEPTILTTAFAIAGIVKDASHSFSMIVSTDPEEIICKLTEAKPDIIGFHCFSGTARAIVNLSAKIKQHLNTPIILGGPHPTLNPDIINCPGIDIVCRGEGFGALKELLDALDRGLDISPIENLWVKKDGQITRNPMRPLISPLDETPEFDYSIYRDYPLLRNESSVGIVSGIGCPFECAFCCNGPVKRLYGDKQPFVRYYSVERVIKETGIMLQHFNNASVLSFHAENIGLDEGYVCRLLREYSAHFNIPFLIAIRAELITPEIADTIRNTRICNAVLIGIESGSSRIRQKVLRKNISDSQILHGAGLLADRGIKIVSTNMFGLPDETQKDILATVRLNRKARVYLPVSSFFTPLPGTDLHKSLCEGGQILDPDMTVPAFSNKPMLKTGRNEIAMNVKTFFQALVLFPRLSFLIKPLLRLRPNLFFELVNLPLLLYITSRLWNKSIMELVKHSVRMEIFKKKIYRLSL